MTNLLLVVGVTVAELKRASIKEKHTKDIVLQKERSIKKHYLVLTTAPI